MTDQGRQRGDGPGSPDELRRLTLLSQLTDTELAEIFAALERREVKAWARLNYRQHVQSRAGFVWNGVFRVVCPASAGVSLSLGAFAEGSAFGVSFGMLEGEAGPALSLVADIAGVVLFVPLDLLVRLARSNPALMEDLARHFAAHAAETMSRMHDLASLDVRGRLQAELLRLCAHSNTWTIRPAPTHAALGAQICAAREAVTRHLSDMQTEGLISFSRGVIEVLDPEALKRLAREPAQRRLFKPRGASE